MFKDVLALAASAIWFALNIVLWILRLPDLEQFGWSVVLGVVFVAGFFSYLGYRGRRKPKRDGE